MTIAAKDEPRPAADFDRPLLLTPAEDWLGYASHVAGKALLFTITATSVLAVLLILIFISREAWPYFAAHGVGELLGSTEWNPELAGKPEFGAVSLIYGSLMVSVGAIVIAVPLGLLVALLLSDMVPFAVRETVKPIIEILAAIPSVALGFFAVQVFAPWLQNSAGLSTGTNALNCSIMLAIMAVPTIISVSEDALSAVGRDLREASYALGATRAETLVKVVLPAAHNGIVAAVILGLMRAVGETMLVWMASGNATQIPHPWYDFTQSIRTITATIAGEMGETPKGSDHYYALFAVGFLLLIFTFGLNLLTEFLLARFRRASGGGHK